MGIVQDIENGVYDPHLDAMREAIAERRNLLGQRKLHRDLMRGDVVRFCNLGMGAKYLNGTRARIVEINRKTVWVEVLPEDRYALQGTRFGRSSRIKVYPNNIELVQFDGVAGPPLKRIEDIFPAKNVTPVDEYILTPPEKVGA